MSKLLQSALAVGLASVGVVLTAVAAASPEGSKQRVAITTQAAKATTTSPFVLAPLQSGALKADSGKMIAPAPSGRDVIREGQAVSINSGSATLRGKHGTLVVRYVSEWVDAGNGYLASADRWKVVRGTGQYAGVKGGGRGASVGLHGGSWSSRFEGVLVR